MALRLPQELRRTNSSRCAHELESLPAQPFHSGDSGSIIACFACAVLGQQSDGQHDRNLDTVDVRKDLIVPEAQHPVALGLEPSRATLVDRETLCLAMLRTIDLDDQLCAVVAKIRDIGSDGCWLAELKAMAIELAQFVPELALGIALLPSHATSPFAHQIGHATTPKSITPRPLPSVATRRSRPWPGR